MANRLTGSIAALSLALTAATTTPAKAANDEVARVLAGAVALFILGSAIQGGGAKAQPTRKIEPQHKPAYRTPQRHGDKPGKRMGASGHGGSYMSKHSRAAVLPRFCQMTMDTRKGPRRVYDKGCVANNMPGAKRIPRECEIRTRGTRGQHRTVYSAHCLSKSGFKVR